MRDDITLETDLGKERKEVWEDKKLILSSMLVENPKEVMEVVK